MKAISLRVAALCVAGLLISAPGRTQVLAPDLDFRIEIPASQHQENDPPLPEGYDVSPLLPEATEPGLHLQDIPFEVPARAAARTEDLWDRLRAGFRMRDLETPLVGEWERWYASRPDYVARVVERSQRYLHHILEEVEKRGMPTEIALLPVIESAYDPRAYSRSHASGIWQFIPSTGKLFGLRQNFWQDDRRDVLAATRAALDYLEKLYDQFGQWDLALAAYNWGEGAVSRAMTRNEARGKPTDYVALDMPSETRNYVPKLQAVKNLVARPEAYGLTLAPIPNQPYFATVKPDRHIDVKVAAELADMPLDEFLALNPAHNRPVIRADADAAIVIPVDRADSFVERLQSHDRPLLSWNAYTLQPGETLTRVAARFGTTVTSLREVNSLSGNLARLVGTTILVPALGKGSLEAALAPGARFPQPAAGRTTHHVVQRGDTLGSVAKRYGVTLAELMSWNGLKSTRIRIGQMLAVSGASVAPQPAPYRPAPAKRYRRASASAR